MKESSPLDSTFLSLQIILIIRATPQIPSLPSKLLVSRKSTRFYRRKQPRGIIILEPFFAKISSATARSYHSERRVITFATRHGLDRQYMGTLSSHRNLSLCACNALFFAQGRWPFKNGSTYVVTSIYEASGCSIIAFQVRSNKKRTSLGTKTRPCLLSID